ncbi:helix-turn-helix domain-containing protein [Methyloligella halotolerans]|nr:helix-turn-helix domain-containing protein [Methyloligella halotolerans]
MAETVRALDVSRRRAARITDRTHVVRRASEAAVAAAFGLEPDELKAATRGPARAAFARQTAMYLAHVGCGLSLTDVGRAFGRDRTTVAHACGVVEDQRDEPEFDFMLTHLERAVAALIAALAPGREA